MTAADGVARPAPAEETSLPPRRGRVGVLIVNLGTPAGTGYWPMRRYLKQFLSDPRVIETPRVIWRPVLDLVILTIRPSRSGRKYDRIWDRARNESPLLTITRAQGEKLGRWARGLGEGRVVVDWAMRYGEPSIASAVARLMRAGCDRILCAPLYPQYSAPSTASVTDELFRVLRKARFQPAVRVVPPWYDDPAYVAALAASVRAALGERGVEPEVILASYHGLPQAYVDKGDPYYAQCRETTRLLRAALGLPEEKLLMTFQSRFGPAQWLKPYNDATLAELARKGVRSVAVVTPGFAADCLETIEEIGMENRDIFLKNGGSDFVRVPCLNDGDIGMEALRTIIARELAGWIDA
jgi:ferrochelatase